MKWQAVFFDFDGVILDSTQVKTDAFRKMFENCDNEKREKMLQYHMIHGGKSRYVKIQHFYENILKQSISEEELRKKGQEFRNLVLKKVLNSRYIDGALATLQLLQENNIPAYVVSGTPHDEINYIVKEKQLSCFFKEVHGSPRLKIEIIYELARKYKFKLSSCLFLGDAITDYDAAKETGVQFLGIVPETEKKVFPQGTQTSPFVTIDII